MSAREERIRELVASGWSRPEAVRFAGWLHRVDVHVQRMSGVSVHDLPDAPFADLFMDEAEPREVAADLLRAEGFDAAGFESFG